MVSVCLGRTEKWYQKLKVKQEQGLKLEVEVGLERGTALSIRGSVLLNPLERWNLGSRQGRHPAPWCCAEVARRGALNPFHMVTHRDVRRGTGAEASRASSRRLIGKVESLIP